MNRSALQPMDFEGACNRLGIDDRRNLWIEGMPLTSRLKPWQVVAIDTIFAAEFDGIYTGHILADVVGLGKTWIAIGVMLAVSPLCLLVHSVYLTNL